MSMYQGCTTPTDHSGRRWRGTVIVRASRRSGRVPMAGVSVTVNDYDTTAATALLDSNALAQRLGVSERFVRRLVEERRVPYLKIGRFVRFDAAEVDRWLVGQRVEPPPLAFRSPLRARRR